ncbi:TMhelix containing protein [Vibrio phage 1.154.O._10N.222.52.B12]|nr:TMhelix containing protein [Vibrio phage 1.154.O._10N.222.52.B12]
MALNGCALSLVNGGKVVIKTVRKLLSKLILVPVYLFGILFMLSVLLYAVTLKGVKVGADKFEKLLDILESAVDNK